MKSWRDDPITQKQREFIEGAMDYSPYPLPKFEGTTKGEASDWISKYGRLAVEDDWAIERGYD